MSARRPGGLWRDGEFLKLWGGESVSLMGAQVTQLALPLAAVYQFQASSTQLGLLNAAGFAPSSGRPCSSGSGSTADAAGPS